jgi:signal recognition particle subunit SRP54
VTVGEVSNLVVRFLEGQKMMRQMMSGGGIPGMPPVPGMRRAAKKKNKNKKKGKGGGRPANAQRRAAPEAGALGGDSQGAAGLGLTGDGAGQIGGLGNLEEAFRNTPGLPMPPGQGPSSLPPGLRRNKKGK